MKNIIRNMFCSIIVILIITGCSTDTRQKIIIYYDKDQLIVNSTEIKTSTITDSEQNTGSVVEENHNSYEGNPDYFCNRSKNDEISAYEGSIALVDQNQNLFLLNLENDEEILLGKIVVLNSVYTSKENLFFIDKQNTEIIEVDKNGAHINNVKAEDNWIEIIGLYNETEVLISNIPINENGSWNPPSKPILINMLSGERKEISTESLDLYKYISGPPHIGRYSYSLLAFNSNMRFVVFPTSLSGEGIGLWNYLDKKEIVKLGSFYPFSEPVWNHAGDKFIISLKPEYYDGEKLIYKNGNENLNYMGGEDLFLVNTNGEITRLTYYTTRYESKEGNYRWSEDDKKIVFWNQSKDDENWNIVRLNIETGEMAEYCGDDSGEPYEIYWSPSANQVIGTTYDKLMKKNIVLIDFNNNSTTIIPTEKTVVGWIE